MSDAAPVKKMLTREEALHLAATGLPQQQAFVVRWQLGALGDFSTLLANIIARADEHNREKLRKGFPMETYAIENWLRGGMAAELRSLGLEL